MVEVGVGLQPIPTSTIPFIVGPLAGQHEKKNKITLADERKYSAIIIIMSNQMDEIIIEDYNPQWPTLFEQEVKAIKRTLNNQNVISIEHFGSTAIPGLRAKPIIDIMVLVTSLDEAKKDIPQLELLSYAYWADNPKKDRLFFVKGLPPYGPRTHHIHIAEMGTELHERLLFRDYLREHPEAAQEYSHLKDTVAKQYKEDREAYTEAKTHFVQAVTDKAKAEQRINHQDHFA